MKTQIINITPSIAKRLLSKNAGNRALNKGNLKYWERQLKEGTALLSHQGIAISGSLTCPKRLLDGQHRLQAIANTGISMKTALFTGCAEDTFKVLDSGRGRTLSDRTALTKAELHAAGFFWRAYYVGNVDKSRMGPDEATAITEIIGEGVAHVDQGYQARNLCRSWAKCAFILQYMEEGDSYYDDYRKGVFERLPTSLLAMYRRVANTEMGQRISDTMNSFWMMSNAISNPDLKQVRLPHRASNKLVKEVVEAKCPELHKLLVSYFPKQ